VRWLSIVALLVLSSVALAKPRVAVAPLDNDTDDKVGTLVVEIASKHAKVIGLEKTKKAIGELGVGFDRKGTQKLRVKLEVEVVIHGSVSKEGSKRELELELHGHGKTKSKLVISARSPKVLRSELSKQLEAKIDEAAAAPEAPGGDDDDAASKPVAVEDKPKPAAPEEHPHHKHVATTDDGTTSVHATSGHKHHHHEGVEEPRDLETQGWLLLEPGVAVARRTLRWTSNGTEPSPPWVGTAGAGGSFGAEVYPFAQDGLGGMGGLGIYGHYTQFFGVAINVPATMGLKASINEGEFEAGVRYRLAFGTSSSLAFGAGFWERYYMADRSGLPNAGVLDMPDVGYKALAPNAVYRTSLGSGLAGMAQLAVPLVFDSGGIGAGTSYGRGTAVAFDLQAGIQYLVSSHFAIDVTGGYDQVGISFSAGPMSQAQLRGVTGSSDKSYGLTAALGVLY
jgi:hypothetical protein